LVTEQAPGFVNMDWRPDEVEAASIAAGA